MLKKIDVNRKRQNRVKKAITPLSKTPKTARKPEHPGGFPIVGIGASAGGLEAFINFLSKVTVDSKMAFVLVQHMDPSQPSRLSELLGKASPIPVQEVEEDTVIEPNHVYVIPSGNDMTIQNHTLKLEAQTNHPGLAHSIDIFFRSLAEAVQQRAVAIILSGTGSDGTDGARVVKARQGLVIVQAPESAKYDGMPRAAIAAGVADYILSPEEMPARLMEYVSKSFNQREEIREALEKDDTSLKKILSLVRARTGRDFTGYKVSSITRRIEHRMMVHRIETSSEYLRYIRETPAEIEDLIKDFLINVTSFFRDKEAFAALKKQIIEILKDKPEGTTIRAWIPGCSTGEEPYSIAILLLESIEASKKYYNIQVFGTDLNTDTITFARSGIYPGTIAEDVDKEWLVKYFNKVDSSFQVKKDLREKLIFAVHDLVSDPPYSRMDIVSVRNLLIYFSADLQKRIIPLLHYALNENGILFLGTAETIGDVPDYFTTVDSKWRIYRSINKQQKNHVLLPGQPALPQADSLKHTEVQDLPAAKPPMAQPPDRLLLEALPPSVLVNHKYHVMYTHGDTSKYLRLPEGNPSMSVLEMSNPDLRIALATAVHEASRERKVTIREGLSVRYKNRRQPVKITVRPLIKMDGSLIVTFEDVSRPKRRKLTGEATPETKHYDLERELELSRETLRNTIEEMDTANEELRSTNEEYMSANEELKSANEELETSREELRSVNEELTTINTEHEKTIEELTAVTDDMHNLLNSTAIATIFLDETLHIRSFTPAATALFNFIDLDVGRPLRDISSRLKADGLPQAASRVLDTLIPSEHEVQTEDGHWYSMRVHPYRTSDNSIEGVVASFVDINQIKIALAYAESIIGTIREPLLVLSKKLKIVSSNSAFSKMFGVNKAETEGQFIYNVGNHQWDIPQLRQLLDSVLKEDKIFEGYRVEYKVPGIGQRKMLLNARRIYDGLSTTPNILLAIEDITGRPGIEAFSEAKEKRKKGAK